MAAPPARARADYDYLIKLLLIRDNGKGSDPEWNETFVFTVSKNACKLIIKLPESDGGMEDDNMGDATIPLDGVYTEGSIPPIVYNVVKDEEYRGEIKIGLMFTLEDARDQDQPEENYGGWNQSSWEEAHPLLNYSA